MTHVVDAVRTAMVFCALSGLVGCPEDPTTEGGGGAGAASSSPTTGPSCTEPYVGDPNEEPIIEVFYMGVDDLNHPVTGGTVLDIIEPPQGGRVSFVAARVKNIDPCGVNLVGELKDPTSGQVRFEARNVLLKPDADGFATIREGQTADYANIPLCFNTWAKQDIYGNDFELTVRVESDRVVESSFTVSLQCTDRTFVGDVADGVVLEACLCTCAEGYVLGDPCDGTEN